MTRTFLTTLAGMLVVASFVLIASTDLGAEASTNAGPTGADLLAAITTPAAN